MSESKLNPLVPLGSGIGVGVTALWAAVELLPLAVMVGAGYIVVKGLEKSNKNTEDSEEK